MVSSPGCTVIEHDDVMSSFGSIIIVVVESGDTGSILTLAGCACNGFADGLAIVLFGEPVLLGELFSGVDEIEREVTSGVPLLGGTESELGEFIALLGLGVVVLGETPDGVGAFTPGAPLLGETPFGAPLLGEMLPGVMLLGKPAPEVGELISGVMLLGETVSEVGKLIPLAGELGPEVG